MERIGDNLEVEGESYCALLIKCFGGDCLLVKRFSLDGC